MLQKIIAKVRFLRAFSQLIDDPERLDLVFALGEQTAGGSLPESMRSPEITAFLARPYRPLEVDPRALRALPEGTLGREFITWIEARGFAIESLHRDHGTSEIERVIGHVERSHDIWHVVTDMDSDPPGEIGLQAFYLAQIGTPLSLVLMAAAFLNAVKYEKFDEVPTLMNAIVRGWHLGQNTRSLFGTDWSQLWHMPLSEVRARFGIESANGGQNTAPMAA